MTNIWSLPGAASGLLLVISTCAYVKVRRFRKHTHPDCTAHALLCACCAAGAKASLYAPLREARRVGGAVQGGGDRDASTLASLHGVCADGALRSLQERVAPGESVHAEHCECGRDNSETLPRRPAPHVRSASRCSRPLAPEGEHGTGRVALRPGGDRLGGDRRAARRLAHTDLARCSRQRRCVRFPSGWLACFLLPPPAGSFCRLSCPLRSEVRELSGRRTCS